MNEVGAIQFKCAGILIDKSNYIEELILVRDTLRNLCYLYINILAAIVGANFQVTWQ